MPFFQIISEKHREIHRFAAPRTFFVQTILYPSSIASSFMTAFAGVLQALFASALWQRHFEAGCFSVENTKISCQPIDSSV